MTLGEKLKKIIIKEKLAEAEKDRLAREKIEKARAKVRRDRESLVIALTGHIKGRIEMGMQPDFKIKDTGLRSWIIHPSEDRDLKDGLVEWLKKEGLELKFSTDWVSPELDYLCVTVTPIPGPEIKAD